MEFEHRQQIRATQIRLLFEQLPSALPATMANASILVAVLWKEVSQRLLVGWLLLILLLALVRYYRHRDYLLPSETFESRHWDRGYFCGVAANKVLWGFRSFFFFTSQRYVHQIFLAFVLASMVSGAMVTVSALPGTHLLFVAPALIPYGVRQVAPVAICIWLSS